MLGPPTLDLACMIFLDRHHSEGLGAPRLEGFPSYEASVARYEELTGFEVKHLDYYQIFAGFRFSVIFIRIAQQMAHYDQLDEAAARALEISNPVSNLTAKLLDLPAPDSDELMKLRNALAG